MPTGDFDYSLMLTSRTSSGRGGACCYGTVFQMTRNGLICCLSSILVRSSMLMVGGIATVRGLRPRGGTSRGRVVSSFMRIRSRVLGQVFSFVTARRLSPVAR